MADRDDLILDHIGRYTISIRPIIEELFFEGGNCGSTLARLETKGLIQTFKKALQSSYSYYQLSAKGASVRGLPPTKASRKNEVAIAQCLAALWFSCKSSTPRMRLYDEELNSLFGAPPGGNVLYVAQSGSDPAVYRLFAPGETTAVKRTYARTLKKIATESCHDKSLAPWIERGTFRFAVLVHSEVRKEELERLLRTEDFPKLPVVIEIAPTPTTLRAFLPEENA